MTPTTDTASDVLTAADPADRATQAPRRAGDAQGPNTGEGGEVFAAVQQAACDELAELIGRAAACRATGLPRSSWYRHNRISPAPPRPAPKPHTERVQPRSLSPAERATVRELLNTEPYLDQAPATVYAKLLDGGEYYCSISTMYRILREHGEVRERRRQATHPPKVKPELLATKPNQVWSWDITKLAGPARGVWFCLYVVIDIFTPLHPRLDDRGQRGRRPRPPIPARVDHQARHRRGHADPARRPGQPDEVQDRR